MQNEITLKNVKIYLGMSEETIAFNADVYFKGTKFASAKNDGQGGCTSVHMCLPGTKDLYDQAHSFVKTLPEVDCFGKGMKQTLDMVIDDLVDEHLQQQEAKKLDNKLKKMFSNQIVWGVRGGDSYRHMGFSNKMSFDEILKRKGGQEHLDKLVSVVKSKLGAGETIWNDNL